MVAFQEIWAWGIGHWALGRGRGAGSRGEDFLPCPSPSSPSSPSSPPSPPSPHSLKGA
ncbi:MAG: hypothetical protein RMY29_022465 [Nostoc sp. CreGUA01]|nr:hypothetical protein [Nostoc sp. CreGUA01]